MHDRDDTRTGLWSRLLRWSGIRGGPRTDPSSAGLVERLRTQALSQPDLTVASTRHGSVVATVCDRARPALARRMVAREVREVLSGAGVEHFWVRGTDQLASAVAVPADDRPAVLAALRRHAENRAWYVSAVTDDRVAPPRPAWDRGAWSSLTGADVVRVTRYLVGAPDSTALGPEYGCDVEFWPRVDGHLVAPRPNRAVDAVPVDGEWVTLPESDFSWLVEPGRRGVELSTRVEFAGRLPDAVPFPIDVVCTWVDTTDPAWQERRDAALRAAGGLRLPGPDDDAYLSDRGDLRWSLRSIWWYAPWVRRIWLVTDDQVPSWLDATGGRVEVVSHKEIFADPSVLPVFNRHAVQTQLHHIEGLADHFLYLDADVVLARPVAPTLFFEPNGLAHFFPSRYKVPAGPPDPTEDPPTSVAGKHGRRLVRRDFGWHVAATVRRAPYALRRDVLAEMERRYRREITTTARQKFPGPRDVSVLTSLYPYYAFATGQAVAGRIRSVDLDPGRPDLPEALSRFVATGRYDVVGRLPGTDPDGSADDPRQTALRDLLAYHLPVPAPWERT